MPESLARAAAAGARGRVGERDGAKSARAATFGALTLKFPGGPPTLDAEPWFAS
jgi:hypothetical protein